MSTVVDEEPRPLSKLLLLGIFTLPLIFSWFLLRRGYSNTLLGSERSYTPP